MNNMKHTIMRKIDDRSIRVGVIGLGYVGLPLAVEKAKAGFHTLGLDVEQSRVDMVNRGVNYIGDIVDKDLTEIVHQGLLSASTDFSLIETLGFIAICVPTPLDNHQQPDTSYIQKSCESISKYLRQGTIVVLESTTYPGTTEDLVRPILEHGSQLTCGVDFYLGFSPERVDPGNLYYKTKNTPKVVGAIGSDALEVISHMYRTVLNDEITEVSSPSVAEMEKILENTYRNINIGLVNELAMLCHKMGISIWEVIDAAKTKPYGFQAFYPGPGLGGHCIPLDPCYLSWKAKEYGFHTSMIETSTMINDRMPEYCVERAGHILNQIRKPLNGSHILLLGVAYKQDINDYRESPALKVLDKLENTGASVDFYDPYISLIVYNGKEYHGLCELDAEALAGYDMVIVTTAHTTLDYELVARYAPLIFDLKNAMKNIKGKENIYLL